MQVIINSANMKNAIIIVTIAGKFLFRVIFKILKILYNNMKIFYIIMKIKNSKPSVEDLLF